VTHAPFEWTHTYCLHTSATPAWHNHARPVHARYFFENVVKNDHSDGSRNGHGRASTKHDTHLLKALRFHEQVYSFVVLLVLHKEVSAARQHLRRCVLTNVVSCKRISNLGKV
jgi:hypothetical protein